LLCGVLLRWHLRGWQIELLPMFLLSSLGLALSRHASIVFGLAVPLYFFLRASQAYFFRHDTANRGTPIYLGATLLCLLGLGAAWGAAQLATGAVCLAFQRGCPTTVARSGCYRINETYHQVPAGGRDAWLAGKTSGLPEQEAFALQAMARNECWVPAFMTFVQRFPHERPDRPMSSAFRHFLLTSDRFATRQMIGHFLAGMHLSPEVRYGALTSLLSTAASPVPSPGAELRVRLGERVPDDRERLMAMRQHPVARTYDWFTQNCLNIIALIGLLAAALVGPRRVEDLALGTSLLLTAVLYLFLISGVAVMVPLYMAPANFLAYLWVGYAICALTSNAGRLREATVSLGSVADRKGA
jgi:hypothetical protein